MVSMHPYEPYIPHGATKLIIGTIPPYRFCIVPQELHDDDVNFYYGSCDNSFWKLLSGITKIELPLVNTEKAIEQRKNILNNLKTGIMDIIKCCEHKNQKSDDGSLKNIAHKPLNELLLDYPSIKTLIYTSDFVKTQINKIADKNYHNWTNKSERKCTTIINGQQYNVIILYSPSPNALRGVDAKRRLEQYKTVFENIAT